MSLGLIIRILSKLLKAFKPFYKSKDKKMQAVRDKLHDITAMRKAKSEAKAEEKVSSRENTHTCTNLNSVEFGCIIENSFNLNVNVSWLRYLSVSIERPCS